MNKLYNGDCLEVMKQIPDNSIDMVLCDLPYGTTRCEWDIPINLDEMWKQYKRICKVNAPILLFSAQPFTTDLIMSNRKDFRYEIIWKKTQPLGFLNANRMPLKTHENIVVFYRKLPTYNPIKRKISKEEAKERGVNIGSVRIKKADRCELYGHVKEQNYIDDGTRYPGDVIEFSNWNGARFGNLEKTVKHPTSKPVEVLEYLIKTYSNEGDTILDNTMGSGSTGIACVNTNRNFIGIELNEDFFKIAENRIREASEQDAPQASDQQMTIFDYYI